MALSLDEICKEVLALPAEQRKIVGEAVSESLGIEPIGLNPAWRVELDHRMNEYRAGRMELVPWEVVEKDLDDLDSQ